MDRLHASAATAAGLDPVEQIKAFMARCSIETTRPSAADITELGKALAPGTEVFVTMLPGKPADEHISFAVGLREAGFEPVPHVSIRHFEDMKSVDAFVGRLAGAAQVRQLLLIGGDTANARGTVRDVQSVIESGILQRHDIAKVNIGGFPDGHPVLNDDDLEIFLLRKLAAIQSGGLEAGIVTQFSFDAVPVIRWMQWLRRRGIHAPVRIGLAGPTNLMAWLNFARKCGVKASAGAIAKRSGLVKQALRPVAPDPLVRTLAEALATGQITNASPHLFSFGGIGATARWASAARSGAFTLNKDGGFDTAR